MSQHASEPGARAQAMTPSGFTAIVQSGDVLHLWQKPVSATGQASVRVRSRAGTVTTVAAPASDDFQLTPYVVVDTGELALDWDASDTLVSLCYAYTPARVVDEGIRVLWAREESRANANRFLTHLAPAFGWMNDPNGMIEIGGRLHAFYQHYPHARHWDTMHWGHAVSENLVDWRHLPVFLHPAATMLADRSKSGGAFSGSAIARAEGGLRIFHTDREDGREPEQEWQMTAVSADLVSTGSSTSVIATRPLIPGFGRDLRDPYVFQGPDGLWKMALGGADETAALVLLYESDDPAAATGWRFVGVLHREPLERPVPAECPCLIALDGEGDGLFVLIFGLISHRSLVKNRRNPSLVLVGRFDGKHFKEIARRELDFIGDCYAFQVFAYGSRPVGIGWAANWADVHRGRDFASSMTFPRRLVWRSGILSTPPIEALSELRAERLTDSVDAFLHGFDLPSGLAEVAVTFASGRRPFRITLSHPAGPLTLAYDGSILEFSDGQPSPRSRAPRTLADVGQLEQVVIFIDVGLIEVYVNGGEWCGTKRIDSDEPIAAVRVESSPDALTAVEIWRLRPRLGV